MRHTITFLTHGQISKQENQLNLPYKLYEHLFVHKDIIEPLSKAAGSITVFYADLFEFDRSFLYWLITVFEACREVINYYLSTLTESSQ